MNWMPPLYLTLAAVHVLAVAVVILAVWRRDRGWLRAGAALAATAAIWLPLLIKLSTLGEPNPHPPDKVMKLLGVSEDDAHNLYLFVDTQPGETVPRMYRVKQVQNKYDDHQYHVVQTGYSRFIGVKVNLDDAGNYEPVYLDYEAPDWDKDAPPPPGRALPRDD